MTLPEPGEPLILADGTIINTDDGTVLSSPNPTPDVDKPRIDTEGNKKPSRLMIEIPRISEAQEIITRVRRKVGDLPVPPKSMNIVAVVLAYHLYGLDEGDIAIATNLSEPQVKRILMGEAFTAMLDTITKAMAEKGKTSVREYFQNASKMAAEQVVELAVNSPDDKVRLKASDSILDRAGHRPVDTVMHKISMENDLVIRIVKSEDELKTLVLDAEDII